MSKIEWTDRTWNPLAGCSIVSKACDNCYAMKMAFRLEHMGQEKYKGTTRKTESGRIIWTGNINSDDKALLEPLKWKKPHRVFVNSMSDMFHEKVPFQFIDKVFAVMALTPHITYQILTKRPERMKEYLNQIFKKEGNYLPVYWQKAAASFGQTLNWNNIKFPLPNVWLGTSVENQKAANERIPHLLKCPAAVRFLSCEPLLGPIQLRGTNWGKILEANSEDSFADFLGGRQLVQKENGSFSAMWIGKIHWVIVGGESGPGARPMHPDWVRSLRDQCQAAGVPFFFKQWGAWLPMDHLVENQYWDSKKSSTIGTGISTNSVFKIGKKAAGRLLDAREWNGMPV